MTDRFLDLEASTYSVYVLPDSTGWCSLIHYSMVWMIISSHRMQVAMRGDSVFQSSEISKFCIDLALSVLPSVEITIDSEQNWVVE